MPLIDNNSWKGRYTLSNRHNKDLSVMPPAQPSFLADRPLTTYFFLWYMLKSCSHGISYSCTEPQTNTSAQGPLLLLPELRHSLLHRSSCRRKMYICFCLQIDPKLLYNYRGTLSGLQHGQCWSKLGAKNFSTRT